MYIYIKIGNLSIAMIDPCDGEKKVNFFSENSREKNYISRFWLEKKQLCDVSTRDTRRAYFLFFSLLGGMILILSRLKESIDIIFAKGNLS